MRAGLLAFVLVGVVAAEPARAAPAAIAWTLRVDGHAPDALARVEARLAAARAEGKPVMVELFAEWCGACRVFERAALADRAVVGSLAGFVTIRVDVSEADERTGALARRFDARVLPSLVLVSARGEVSRVAGGVSAGELLAAVAKAR